VPRRARGTEAHLRTLGRVSRFVRPRPLAGEAAISTVGSIFVSMSIVEGSFEGESPARSAPLTLGALVPVR